MRRCTLFFRLRSQRTSDDDGVEHDGRDHDGDINEKHIRKPREWSAIFLTAIRVLQFAYFAFAYYALHDFWRSSYFRNDGPWEHSPGHLRHSRRMMRWLRMQASITLIYQAAVLVVPWMLRLLRATKRPFANLATVFGDGTVVMGLLNTLVILDTDHEGYCHRPPPRGDFDLREVFSFAKGGHHHNMSRHRSVCHSLDVIFGLGGLIILSHLVTAVVTARRAKRASPTVFAKVERAGDVEQGIPQRVVCEQPSTPATPQRRQSPPPPYRPVVSDLAQEHPTYAERSETTPIPRGRCSVETTSSLGFERYLVSDGWRAPEGPPEYSSRPPSLHHHALA